MRTPHLVRLFPPPLLTPNSNSQKWWYSEKSCRGFNKVYPDIAVISWRCTGIYGRKARYYFAIGMCPEEALKLQFAFEVSLVKHYDRLEQDAFESRKPGRTQRLDRLVEAELLPLARELAK